MTQSWPWKTQVHRFHFCSEWCDELSNKWQYHRTFEKSLSLFVFIRCLNKRNLSWQTPQTNQSEKFIRATLCLICLNQPSSYSPPSSVFANPTIPNMDHPEGRKSLSWRANLGWGQNQTLGGKSKNLGWLCRWSKHQPGGIQKPDCSCEESVAGMARGRGIIWKLSQDISFVETFVGNWWGKGQKYSKTRRWDRKWAVWSWPRRKCKPRNAVCSHSLSSRGYVE